MSRSFKGTGHSIIDDETGEKIREINYGDTITSFEERKRRKERYENKLKKDKRDAEFEEYYKQKKWVASYTEEIKELSQMISLEEAGAAFKIILYLNMNSGGRLDVNGRALRRTELQEILGVGKTQAQIYLKTLSSKEVNFLLVDKKEKPYTYHINKQFHSMGSKITDKRTFVKIYKEKTKELIDGVKLRHLGMLYILQPYFHFQSGYLCKNSKEDVRKDGEISFYQNWLNGTIKDIKHFTEDELAKILNKKVETVTKYLTELCQAGFLMYSRSNNKFTIKVRPDVMFAIGSEKIDVEYQSFVMAEFKQIIDQKVKGEDKVSFTGSTLKQEHKDKLIKKIKNLLKENPYITKTLLAKQVGISRGHLYRLLKTI